MEKGRLESVVLNYLRKKGYKATEDALVREARIATLPELTFATLAEGDAGGSHFIFYDQGASSPSRYDESYSRLRAWADESLDQYKNELSTVLFPIFVHCYLDLVAKGFTDEARLFLNKHQHDHVFHHGGDLHRLQTVTQAQHIQGHDFARSFRENKYNLRLCTYSYELLYKFLQDSKSLLLLSVVNQYLNIQVFPGGPSNDAIGVNAITSESSEQVEGINSRAILWGQLNELQPPGKDESDTEDADSKEPMAKRRKKGVFEATQSERDRIENAPAFDRVPLPEIDEITTRIATSEDLKFRSSSSSPPSVCMYTLYNTYDSINSVVVSDDAAVLAAGTSDSSVLMWDVKRASGDGSVYSKTRTTPKRLVGHSGPVYSLSLDPASDFLVSCSEDATARLWSLEMGKNLVCYKGHNFPIWDVSFSALGYYFATASHDRTARLWRTDSPQALRIFAGHLSDVDCVKFHPNCNYLATGSSDKSVRLWDVQTGECVRVFTGHRDAVLSLAFSPDGRMLATGGEGRDVLLWDLGTGKRVKVMDGHQGAVWALDFSSSGALLASAGADCSVRLWSSGIADTGAFGGITSGSPKETPLQVLYTKNTPVFDLRFTPRNLLISAGPVRFQC